MHGPFVTKYHFALLDNPTGVVLTIGTSLSAMIFVTECTPDTFLVPGVQTPNYEGLLSRFFIPSIEPTEFPTWTWNPIMRKFTPTKTTTLTDRLVAKSALAEGKRVVFEKMVSNLNFARAKIASVVWLQERIYAAKKIQAQAYKDSGYAERLDADFSYVEQYADYAGISLHQAADDILLKAEFATDILSKTELVRLRHFNILKAAKSPDQLPKILEEFLRDCNISAPIEKE